MSALDRARMGWLTTAVLAHLALSFLHGSAHAGAHVPMALLSTFFVVTVIVIGPVAGIILAWVVGRVGAWLVALTMAGSFIFGVLNHFVLSGPDHVAQVDPSWRLLFAASAGLLAVTEAIGAVLAFRVVRDWTRDRTARDAFGREGTLS